MTTPAMIGLAVSSPTVARLIQLAPHLFLLFSFSPLSVADEEILDFQGDVGIHSNRSDSVIDTVVVNVEGRETRRSIYRDFPADYRDRLGNR